jgi:hypothetical protein
VEIASILLQIGDGVRPESFVGLEECIEFRSRLESEQPAQVRSGQTAALVFFHSQRLKRAARQIIASGSEPFGYVIWDFQGHIHVFEPIDADGETQAHKSPMARIERERNPGPPFQYATPPGFR